MSVLKIINLVGREESLNTEHYLIQSNGEKYHLLNLPKTLGLIVEFDLNNAMSHFYNATLETRIENDPIVEENGLGNAFATWILLQKDVWLARLWQLYVNHKLAITTTSKINKERIYTTKTVFQILYIIYIQCSSLHFYLNFDTFILVLES